MASELRRLKDPSLFKTQAYINGEFINARSGSTFDVHDPCTGDVIGTMPEMGAEETELAIDAAWKAFVTFKTTTARHRGRLLRKWYELMMENIDDLATIITLENGKPLAESRSEVKYAAEFVEWFSEEAPRIGGETISASTAGRRVYTTREPVGVCGLITPWNWPAGMVCQLSRVSSLLPLPTTITLTQRRLGHTKNRPSPGCWVYRRLESASRDSFRFCGPRDPC
jgi:succinate-semialdehyde dehydrogenase / glutarate-semialdehyde dehydrogenase